MVAVLPQIAGAAAAGVVLMSCRTYGQGFPLLQLGAGLMLSYATAVLTMSLLPGGRETLMDALDAGRHLLLHVKSKARD